MPRRARSCRTSRPARPKTNRRALVATAALALGACAGDAPTDPAAERRPHLATAVAADDAMVLARAGTVTLTIAATECAASGNVITLTSPVRDVLTEDACYDTGATRTYGPFPAGARIAIDFFAAALGVVVGADRIRMTGSYPRWTILYEDLDDFDFNDVELAVVVTANAAPRVDRLLVVARPANDPSGLGGVALRVRLRDPGDVGPWDWRIEWGDGVVHAPTDVALAGEFVFLRRTPFVTPGPHTIRVTATDPGGLASALATTHVP